MREEVPLRPSLPDEERVAADAVSAAEPVIVAENCTARCGFLMRNMSCPPGGRTILEWVTRTQ
jgi:hypothetical protein